MPMDRVLNYEQTLIECLFVYLIRHIDSLFFLS